MLELIGVDGLTQWDVGRQINVDKDVDMVHFSNRPYGYSKNVKVTDGVADVPDMFLTSCAPLRVWAYVGDFEKGYTKIEKIYEVKPKNRPEDYIYTPEEVKTWEKLQSEIGDISDLETEAKENLVAAINEAAKSGGESYTLPQATSEALGGVKADPATKSDTQPVRIGNDGKLVTAAGRGIDISLGLTSATVGQIIKVKAVNEQGMPTAWEAVDDRLPNISPSDNGKALAVQQTGDFEYGYGFADIPQLVDFINLGITGASPGKLAKVKFVDDFGQPSAWEAVDMPSGGGGSGKLETFDGMQLLASGTITNGTAAGTITDTGVTYGAFKQWHRVIFLRRCAYEQGNFSNGYGAGNNAGFRSGLANLSVTLEHIDGYLWKYWYHATSTAPYVMPTTEIQELTGTLWTPATITVKDCDIGEGYIDIRINNKNSFSDNNTFVIKNWAALTADVSWYIYGLTKEVTQ